MTYDPNFQETPPKQIIICIPAYNEEKNIGEIVSKRKLLAAKLLFMMMVRQIEQLKWLPRQVQSF